MKLILSVLSFKNQFISEINDITIDQNGGSIGRSPDNTLVLPDSEKIVSRHHATIYFENGCYYLSDNSLSGVYINNRETPLHNATERIDNGMVLRIGEYEITISLINEPANNDSSPFVNDVFSPFSHSQLSEPEPSPFVSSVEPLFSSEQVGFNPLMADDFAKHEELIPTKENQQQVPFESGLQQNRSPLLDSHISPQVSPVSTAPQDIPENLSFDDFFAEMVTPPAAVVDKPVVSDDFESLFGVQLSPDDLQQASDDQPLASEENPLFVDQPASVFENAKEPASVVEDSVMTAPVTFEAIEANAVTAESLPPVVQPSVIPAQDSDTLINNEFKTAAVTPSDTVSVNVEKKSAAVPQNTALFDAFLQGAKVQCASMSPEQQAEALYRVGQMFRELIEGTVAVLRSRAEFKSLCRVSMTVIKAADNNPLKFTVSSDDVLRQLIENDMDGFLSSTVAIEQAFDDIMNHQIAMQAGIQASLMDLLKTFDPKIIEKQFEQGIILQKKAKCWERYEDTYKNTVDEAVENFFGEEFVKAYERQMSLLNYSRKDKQ